MRSSEVAKAADVSVRTLRHYHALGLLPEPPRSENGYRDYSPLDVARVLRIKRLASLGLSLSDIAELESNARPASIAAPEAGRRGVPFDCEDAALAALDSELTRKIEALQAQRRTIAELRAERLDPALPVGFSRAIRLFYGNDQQAADTLDITKLSEEDKAALVLAAHFYSEKDTEDLERFAIAAKQTGAMEQIRSLERRISMLSADATEAEQDALVAEAIELVAPLLNTLDPANWVDEDEERWALFDSLIGLSQNSVQRAVNERIENEIAERMHAIARATLGRP